MIESKLDINQIKDLLPHRFPFLLVDRVVKSEAMYIETLKNVTFNEPFFQGHFPYSPVMPGVLIVEAMAQSGGIYAISNESESLENKNVFFISIDKVRFRKPVIPGDQLIMKIEIKKSSGNVLNMKGVAYVDEDVVAEAKMIAVVK